MVSKLVNLANQKYLILLDLLVCLEIFYIYSSGRSKFISNLLLGSNFEVEYGALNLNSEPKTLFYSTKSFWFYSRFFG